MDPGLLSGSSADRSLCPGNRPPASAPGRASRFFKCQPPHAPGIFPFYSQPGPLPPYLEKAVQNSSLPPAPFFWPWGFPLTTEQQAWEPDWPGPLWLSFSSFPCFLSFTSVRLGAFLGRKSALALENSRQLPGSRCSLDLSRTGGLILVLLGILKLL